VTLTSREPGSTLGFHHAI